MWPNHIWLQELGLRDANEMAHVLVWLISFSDRQIMLSNDNIIYAKLGFILQYECKMIILAIWNDLLLL